MWEVTDADPLAATSMDFGIYVSYGADQANLPALGTAAFHGTYALLGAANTASAGPMPQFVGGSSSPVEIFRVTPCLGPQAPSVVSAVLPSSRSVQVGAPATAFATIINTGFAAATSCGIAPLTGIPATFSFRTTNQQNVPNGPVDTPIDIPAGASKSYVVSVTPTGPMAPTLRRTGSSSGSMTPDA